MNREDMSASSKTSELAVSDPPLVTGNQSFTTITDTVPGVAERKTTGLWLTLFAVAVSLTLMLGGAIGWLFWEGIGIWGVNIPVGWGFAIVNFVFWVGIGHAGTLISAILFLFRQRWRTAINRFAEAMTLFAVICALIFPGIHVGLVWAIDGVFPIPNQMSMWPNFRSPLLWDVFAVSIYFTCSVLFWYTGIVPDLASMRDRAKTRIRKIVFGISSLGWRGGNRQWKNYEKAYLILAGVSTPLVLSVHSVVSTDFASALVPGWHSTIFPPYFVAGAIFSGFAMVLSLGIIMRKLFALEHLITIKHLENMNLIMLVTGLMVGYSYGCEFFVAWYCGNAYEEYAFLNRAFGPMWWSYWIMIFCNVVVPQVFWFKNYRTSVPIMFVASLLINVGMWFERFVIVVTSLTRDFLPSSWGSYVPTRWDIMTLIGSFGLFFSLFLLFSRYLPVIAMSEIKTVLPQAKIRHHGQRPEGGGSTAGDHR